MRVSLRIALSFLITVIAFSAFILFAYSGFFNYIESHFYNDRVADLIEAEVSDFVGGISKYHTLNEDRFRSLLGNDFISDIFYLNKSRETIFTINNRFKKLLSEYPGLLYIRFVDQKGFIHYSTLSSDVKQQDTYSIIYHKYDIVEPDLSFDLIATIEENSSLIYIDQDQSRLIYSFAVYDNLGQHRGSALFSVALKDLKMSLMREQLLEIGRPISFIEQGYIINIDVTGREVLVEDIVRAWESDDADVSVPIGEDSNGIRYYLFSEKTVREHFVGYMVPETQFLLDDTLRILLILSFFATLFLVIFVLLSLRQDRSAILADRIRKFQVNFLKEYFENREDIDAEKFRSDIQGRKEYAKRELKKGLGKLRKDSSVDEMIETSWDEVISVIDNRLEQRATRQIEVANLEETLQRILSNKTFEVKADVVQGTTKPVSPIMEATKEEPSSTTRTTTGTGQASTTGLHDIGTEPEEIEEVEELEEVTEAAVVEQPEAVEEVEEAESAEAVEEAEELEALEEVEEPEELEALEEVDELEEIEEVEELEEVAEAPAVEQPETVGSVEVSEEDTQPEPEETRPTRVEETFSMETSGDSYFRADEEVEEFDIMQLPEIVVPEEHYVLERIRQGQPRTTRDLMTQEEDVEELDELEDIVGSDRLSETVVQGSEITEQEETDVLDLVEIFQEGYELADIDVFDDDPVGVLENVGDENQEPDEETTLPESITSDSDVTDSLMARSYENPEVHIEETPDEFEDSDALEELDELEEIAASTELAEIEEPEILEELEEVSESSSEVIDDEVRTITGGENDSDSVEVAELETVLVGSDVAAAEPVSNQYIGYSFPYKGYNPSLRNSIVEKYYEDGNLEPVFDDAEGIVPGYEIEPDSAVMEEAPSQTEEDISKETDADQGFEYDEIVQRLVDSGVFEVTSASKVFEEYGSVQAIRYEDGVYQIDTEVIAQPNSGRDESLRDLVGSVIESGEDEEAEEAADDFLGLTSVDLGSILSDDQEPESSDSDIDTSSGRIIDENGIDYDTYLTGFRRNGIGVTKSLMRVTQRTNSIFATILVETPEEWSVEQSLGLSSDSLESFKFPKDGIMVRNFLSHRDFLLITKKQSMLREIDASISNYDKQYLNGSLYVPIVYEGRSAYLFMGLKNVDRGLNEYIASLVDLKPE